MLSFHRKSAVSGRLLSRALPFVANDHPNLALASSRAYRLSYSFLLEVYGFNCLRKRAAKFGTLRIIEQLNQALGQLNDCSFPKH